MRIIASLGQGDHVVGGAGIVPWTVADVRRQVFEEIDDQVLVVGRRTWELVGTDLPAHRTVVLSRSIERLSDAPPGTLVVPNLALALEKAAEIDPERGVFVAGGASVFRQALPFARGMVLAVVKVPLEGDLYFPDFSDREWWIEDSWEHPSYELLHYSRRDVA